MTEEEEECCFLIAKTVVLFNVLNKIVHVIAPVYELAGDRFPFTLVYNITMNVAYIGNTRHYAGTVAVAETSIDKKILIKVLIYDGIFSKSAA